MILMRNHKDRIKLAWKIRNALPWSSVVAGAVGCRFVEIARGEQFRGSRTFGRCTEVWSREVIGSRLIQWNGDGPVLVWEYIRAQPTQHSAMKLIHQTTLAAHGRGWLDAAAEELVKLAADWLVPVAKDEIAKQLKADEQFEIRIHPLETMP